MCPLPPVEEKLSIFFLSGTPASEGEKLSRTEQKAKEQVTGVVSYLRVWKMVQQGAGLCVLDKLCFHSLPSLRGLRLHEPKLKETGGEDHQRPSQKNPTFTSCICAHVGGESTVQEGGQSNRATES
jgi:hypothetical protein